MKGEKQDIVSNNADEVDTVVNWLTDTKLKQVSENFFNAEKDAEKAKKSLAKAKKDLVKAML